MLQTSKNRTYFHRKEYDFSSVSTRDTQFNISNKNIILIRGISEIVSLTQICTDPFEILTENLDLFQKFWGIQEIFRRLNVLVIVSSNLLKGDRYHCHYPNINCMISF